MSSRSSNAAERLAVLNVLQDEAAAHPDFQITASGVAQRTGVDVAIVREAMTDASHDHLLVPHLVAKCLECGGETPIHEPDEASDAVCEHQCQRRTEHAAYVVYTFAPAILNAAGRRNRPKAQRRQGTPQRRMLLGLFGRIRRVLATR